MINCSLNLEVNGGPLVSLPYRVEGRPQVFQRLIVDGDNWVPSPWSGPVKFIILAVTDCPLSNPELVIDAVSEDFYERLSTGIV